MAKKYHKRAEAIHTLLKSLLHDLENASGYSDRAALITSSVEVVNTLLYTFDFSPDTYKNIDELLNDDFRNVNDESDINRIIDKVKDLLKTLTIEAETLLKEYTE